MNTQSKKAIYLFLLFFFTISFLFCEDEPKLNIYYKNNK